MVKRGSSKDDKRKRGDDDYRSSNVNLKKQKTKNDENDDIKNDENNDNDNNIVPTSTITTTTTTITTNNDDHKKQKTKKLKPWKIRPSNDEGIEVPKSKQHYKDMGNGVKVLDVIIGKGIEPKPGSEIRLAYIGLFTDGTIFDERTAVKKPFIFRKGIGQVIKGLDIGVKGLRIGGSREIIIPPEYG